MIYFVCFDMYMDTIKYVLLMFKGSDCFEHSLATLLLNTTNHNLLTGVHSFTCNSLYLKTTSSCELASLLR